MKEASSSNPQIKDLDGSKKTHTDREEFSGSNPQIKSLDDHYNRENADMHKASIANPWKGIEVELKKSTEERRKKSKVNIGRYRPLIRAIQENNVKAQKDFLNENPDAMKSEIDEFGNTVFHLIVQQSVNSATVKLLEELVSMVDSSEKLEISNVNNMTALDIAASAGNTKAVKVFVKKYTRLLCIEDEELDLLQVLHHAASWGRKETVRYLLPKTDWTEENDYGASLLKKLIDSNLHGIAIGVLKHYPNLALPEGNKFWNDIVQMLSEKYLAFASGIRLGFWENLIYHYIPEKDDQDRVAWSHRDSEDGDLEMQNPKSSTNCSEEFPQIASTIDALKKRLWNALFYLVPSIKRIHDHKLMHTQTLEIVKLMISKVDWTYKEASERLKEPVLTAAKLGIYEFVNEVLKAYPNSGGRFRIRIQS
ncbi:hypothetical protein QYF36_007535 [Acer negundo]|nr:hypothetical protein QYF36_007535 [Acer negundo]